MSSFHTLTVDGITLHKTKALQKVGYVCILTKQQGIIEARYRHPQTLKSQFTSKLEPFTQGKFELYTRNKTPTLKTVTNPNTQHIQNITPTTLELLAYITKITRTIFPKGQPIPHCFKAINLIVKHLTNISPSILLLHFLHQAIYQAGIMPNLKQCQKTKKILTSPAYYNSQTGEFSNSIDNPNDIIVTTSTRKLIAYSDNLNLLQKITLPTHTLSNSINLLVLILANYIQQNPTKIMPSNSLMK